MDYVKPSDLVAGMVEAGCDKAGLEIPQLLLRGALAGAFLGVATSMSVAVAVETGLWIVGSLVFPFGLCLVVLLKMELLTGSFALLPCATADGRTNARPGRVLANWGWVFLGNLLGSLTYAALLAVSLTVAGDAAVSAVGTKLMAMAEAKTTYYAQHGQAGLLTVFVKAVLCNWLVSLAVVMAFASKSLAGKMLAIWGPAVLFFSQGFEHAVVNMFVIPVGMLLGAKVGLGDWWLWNQLPVTLGNLAGGMLLTGLPIYFTHRAARLEREPGAGLLPEPGRNGEPAFAVTVATRNE